ncbi:MAG: alpha-isopropylmalate synthase regulatory domain-containing protein [Ilumatobacteraceae bacterium]
MKALRSGLGATLDVTDYTEHAVGQGSEAMAVAYVETHSDEHGVLWGVGTDPSTITASLRAVLSAHERSQRAWIDAVGSIRGSGAVRSIRAGRPPTTRDASPWPPPWRRSSPGGGPSVRSRARRLRRGGRPSPTNRRSRTRADRGRRLSCGPA